MPTPPNEAFRTTGVESADDAREWLRLHKLSWPPCQCDANRVSGIAHDLRVRICEECDVMCPVEVVMALEGW